MRKNITLVYHKNNKTEIQKIFEEQIKQKENEKYTPTKEELDMLEKILDGKYNGPEKKEVKVEPYVPTEEDLEKWECM